MCKYTLLFVAAVGVLARLGIAGLPVDLSTFEGKQAYINRAPGTELAGTRTLNLDVTLVAPSSEPVQGVSFEPSARHRNRHDAQAVANIPTDVNGRARYILLVDASLTEVELEVSRLARMPNEFATAQARWSLPRSLRLTIQPGQTDYAVEARAKPVVTATFTPTSSTGTDRVLFVGCGDRFVMNPIGLVGEERSISIPKSEATRIVLAGYQAGVVIIREIAPQDLDVNLGEIDLASPAGGVPVSISSSDARVSATFQSRGVTVVRSDGLFVRQLWWSLPAGDGPAIAKCNQMNEQSATPLFHPGEYYVLPDSFTSRDEEYWGFVSKLRGGQRPQSGTVPKLVITEGQNEASLSLPALKPVHEDIVTFVATPGS